MTLPPTPEGKSAWLALKALIQQRNILASLEVLHDELGDVFKLPLPGFNTTVLVGPEANHFLLVEAKKDFRWRSERDPVTSLLRHGFLVEDGDTHDDLRRTVNPPLHRNMLSGYVEKMWQRSDQVSNQWHEATPVNLLDEMRRIAILVLMDTIFEEDFSDDLKPLWEANLRTLAYISPGLWLIWPGMMRPGYGRSIEQMDNYLYGLINRRRKRTGEQYDVVGGLIAGGLSDDLIRDQLLTLFIAGHDTSTALLTWALYLLMTHPSEMEQVQTEVDQVLGASVPTYENSGQLSYLECVIKETLRLYPPIHLGSRIAATDIQFQDYLIPAHSRVIYSIYLTHRHKKYWTMPDMFRPDRFAPENGEGRTPYTFLPFGGGVRNCVGAAFAQVEAKIILARLIQKFNFRLTESHVRPRMGATLEPHPKLKVEIQRRSSSN
jgi:cytochrome P450